MGDKTEDIEIKDAAAFQSLFTAFFPKVLAMLMRQGADKETAEEIAQDTMFTVWRKAHQFSGDKGSVSAWIYAIARNLRIDRIRKAVGWQQVYSELEVMERLHGDAGDAQHWVGERDDIEKALQGLPAEQLEVVQLSFIDGLSQTEIAARLGLPLGTVKSRMRLAFEKMRSVVGRDA
jgi:RNA polymerase sigma-70 factor (ECF subfamily)